MNRALLAMVILLIGCEEERSYRMVKSPDGNHWWYDVTCSGSMADCMDNARRACKGRAYDVVEANGAGSHGGAVGARVGNAVIVGSHASADMEIMVQCAPLRHDKSNDREILPPGTPPTPNESE